MRGSGPNVAAGVAEALLRLGAGFGLAVAWLQCESIVTRLGLAADGPGFSGTGARAFLWLEPVWFLVGVWISRGLARRLVGVIFRRGRGEPGVFWFVLIATWLAIALAPVVPWHKGEQLMGYWPLYVVYLGGVEFIREWAGWVVAHQVVAIGFGAGAWWMRNCSRARRTAES